MFDRFLNLFRRPRMDALTEFARLADDGSPLAAIEPPSPTVPTLSPWEPGPWLLGLGWSEISPNPGATRPMICLRVIGPLDESRYAKYGSAGVNGLAATARTEAATLPSVLRVQGLRRDMIAVVERSRQAAQRAAEARAERKAILEAEPTEESAARFPLTELAIARGEHQQVGFEREAAAIAKEIPVAIREADHVLRAYGRSLAELKSRELAQEFIETVKQLPGDVFERLLILHTAAAACRSGGDRVYGMLRDLLGNELPPENLEVPADDEHAVAASQEAAHLESIERERLNGILDDRPREQPPHFLDRRTGRLVRVLQEGERIPDVNPFAAHSEPRAAQAEEAMVPARALADNESIDEFGNLHVFTDSSSRSSRAYADR